MAITVRVEHLTVRHVGRRLPALRDLTLDWESGERLLLLGPSGSGKSTLALCLNGIIPHSLEAHWEQGRVLVGGRDTRQTGAGTLATQIGVLFQDPEAQFVMLHVDDEIAFGLENLAVPRPEMIARVRAARALVGLDPVHMPSRLDQLSGGTKQRVMLAALLAMGTPSLVLDEPTANLDPSGAHEVHRVLSELSAGRRRSVLLVEHRLDEVLELVDRVAVLDATGHLALQGSPGRVFGTHAGDLRRLGVWTPQLADLARLLDQVTGPAGAGTRAVPAGRLPAGEAGQGWPERMHLPRSPSEAAVLLASGWPGSGPEICQTAGVQPSAAGGQQPAVSPLLSVRDLTYRYHGGAINAVESVSLDVAAGEYLALVGQNAAGKTTLGLLLAGVLRPAAGAVLLEGRDLRVVPELAIRSRLSYVFQYPEHQFVARTVQEEVLFGLRVRGYPPVAGAQRARDILERFGLAHLGAASPFSLSHGQKRRLSVATALVTAPEVLILDEPTFGQDRRHTDELLELLEQLNRAGRTIVVITHDLALVAERTRRVVALARGRIVFDGTPHALFARPDVLAQCGLRLPPVAHAIALARQARPEIPPVISLPELERALAAARVPIER